MKFLNFVSIIDQINLYAPLKTVTFSGGEPLLWPELPQAIKYLREKHIISIVLTNAFFDFRYLPEQIRVNLRPYVDASLNEKKIIEQNIRKWMSHKSNVSTTFAFGEEDSEEVISYILDFTEKLKIPLAIYPRYFLRKEKGLPYKDPQLIGEKLKKFLEILHTRQKQQYFPKHAIAPCVYSYKKEYMEHSNVKCKECPLFRPTFFSDGKQVSFCSLIKETLNIRNFNHILALEEALLDIQRKKESNCNPTPECSDCKLFQKTCFGSCLALY